MSMWTSVKIAERAIPKHPSTARIFVQRLDRRQCVVSHLISRRAIFNGHTTHQSMDGHAVSGGLYRDPNNLNLKYVQLFKR
ncbi:hypothetical protein J6590_040531 [Homalodisca vitripennis]|nr:hypothetical protein J6590_040531 [Homalodisca vitripennis]